MQQLATGVTLRNSRDKSDSEGENEESRYDTVNGRRETDVEGTEKRRKEARATDAW
jgi:hypothetical protein